MSLFWSHHSPLALLSFDYFFNATHFLYSIHALQSGLTLIEVPVYNQGSASLPLSPLPLQHPSIFFPLKF